MLEDVRARFVSAERARDIYGVVLAEGERPEELVVDQEATGARRDELRRQGGVR